MMSQNYTEEQKKDLKAEVKVCNSKFMNRDSRQRI